MRFPERTQFAMASTFSADVGHTALFGALCLGGTLHVLSRRRALSPSGLAEYFAQHPVDFLKIAPSHFRALWAGGSGILPRRGVLFGGEALPWTLVDSVLNERPNLALHNYYGPSETTASITTHHTNRTAPRVSASVPIGLGLADVRLYVLDGRLEPTQVGEPGELYVGGLAVSRGYLGRADLTAERYLPDPFAAQDGLRMYQTGDRVRQLVGGELEFLGRADSQVKIRGFRVELGEVEAALAAQPQVREARVVVRRDASDREQLVGYVVGVGVALLDGDALRRSLGQQLPDYMVPIAVVPIATMPLTSNGKLDQSALPLPEALEPK